MSLHSLAGKLCHEFNPMDDIYRLRIAACRRGFSSAEKERSWRCTRPAFGTEQSPFDVLQPENTSCLLHALGSHV